MWIYIAHCQKISNALSDILETMQDGGKLLSHTGLQLVLKLPLMILSAVMAVILRHFSDFGSLHGNQLHTA